MSKCRSAVLMATVAASAAAFGFVCEVSPQGLSLGEALAKARASGEAEREIVLADGNGARTPLAEACCKEVRGGMARLHVIECRLPFRDLGVVPKKGVALSFNASRYTSFYRETRWYSAPGGEVAKLVLQ